MHHPRRASRSRSIGYALVGPLDDARADTLLHAARDAGIISEFDSGRGDFLWFNGPPGARLRAFRARLLADVGGHAVPRG